MNIIKNFLPENNDKKIYAVMSVENYKEITIDEMVIPVSCTIIDDIARIQLDKVFLKDNKEIDIVFKCKYKSNSEKTGEYTLTYTYFQIKEMAELPNSNEDIVIKFEGYTDEGPDGFMQDLKQAIEEIKNK